MSTLTLRFPENKHVRLKQLAASRAISVNKLLDELATIALANFDARASFAARGDIPYALSLLDRLDQAEK